MSKLHLNIRFLWYLCICFAAFAVFGFVGHSNNFVVFNMLCPKASADELKSLMNASGTGYNLSTLGLESDAGVGDLHKKMVTAYVYGVLGGDRSYLSAITEMFPGVNKQSLYMFLWLKSIAHPATEWAWQSAQIKSITRSRPDTYMVTVLIPNINTLFVDLPPRAPRMVSEWTVNIRLVSGKAPDGFRTATREIKLDSLGRIILSPSEIQTFLSSAENDLITGLNWYKKNKKYIPKKYINAVWEEINHSTTLKPRAEIMKMLNQLK